MLYDILQIIIALIVIALMGVIAYSIYNRDTTGFIEDMTKEVIIKKKVKIIDGTMSYDNSKTAVINTSVPYYGNYKEIVPSINQKGGAEYSYSFWLYIPESAESPNIQKVLFLKGSKTKTKYISKYNNCHSNSGWYLVKNPLIKVNINSSNNLDAIIAEFNTIKSPDAVHESPEILNCNSADLNDKDKNLFGIYGLSNRTDLQNNWSMVTLVVSETNPSSDIMFRNEAVVKMYLNGYEYFNKTGDAFYSGGTVTTAMRNNNGNLYINPDISSSLNNVAIADLTYFNYALSDEEVIRLHKVGFNKQTASLPQKIEFDTIGEGEAVKLETEKSNNIKTL